MTTKRERRYGIVAIRPDMLAGILLNKQGPHFHVEIDGLPPSSELVNTAYDISSDSITLIFYDDSFPVVPDSNMIPVMIMSITWVDCRALMEATEAAV